MRGAIGVGRAFSEGVKGTESETILRKYRDIAKAAAVYIEEHYNEDLTLERITQEINYSKSYFCYLFKAVMGRIYVEYLSEVRIRHAQKMLLDASKTVTEIAFSVGYKTVATFNKCFKQITGVTPSNYRKTIK